MVKTKITTYGPVTMSEYRYLTGFAEISFKIPEVIPGAGAILTAVVSRQVGKGCKWCVYAGTTGSTPVYRSLVKKNAVDVALSESGKMYQERKHLYQKVPA